MKACGLKNDLWIYVSGLKPKQELIENDANSNNTINGQTLRNKKKQV